MQSHYYKGEGCGYPVGTSMKDALRVCKSAAKIFNKIDSDYPKYRPINLWCRGSSGAILAALFASHLKRKVIICHVKKVGEKSHSGDNVADSKGINIFIDDFIATGETIRAIYKNFHTNGFHHVDCFVIGGQYGSEAEYLYREVGFVPAHLITNQR